MSAPIYLVFSKVSKACPKFLTRDVRTNDPGTSAEYPAPKLSLWADVLFLISVFEPKLNELKKPLKSVGIVSRV